MKIRIRRWGTDDVDADFLDGWLRNNAPERHEQVRLGFRNQEFRAAFVKDRLAEAVIATLFSNYRLQLEQLIVNTEDKENPVRMIWGLALEILCSTDNMDHYIQSKTRFHKSVKQQVGKIGASAADYTRNNSMEVLKRLTAAYNPAKRGLGSFVKTIALSGYLSQSPYCPPITGRPALADIAAARIAGLIDLRAATLLKTCDYGGSGLNKEEAIYLNQIWGQFNQGQKFPQLKLAQKLGITRGSLKTELARWRKKAKSAMTPGPIQIACPPEMPADS